MADVALRKVRKSFGTHNVIPALDLEIRSGEFMVLVGPSGCGKSTLLRMVAGLEETTAGEIAFAGEPVNHLPPKARGVAMVFQNYALYPHMTVRENMAFALKLSKLPKTEIDSRVNEAARILAIEEHLHKKPGQLSGGQKQRVAMGRAMVRQPKVFLFDEPLSNLDAQLRVRMRTEIAQLHRRLGCTVIYVTHDQVEAMTLATRIAVMNKGVIEQVGAPLDVYHDPHTRFVASFIGTPQMNFLEDGGVGFRPEALKLSGGDKKLGRAKVVLVEPLGVTAHVHYALGDTMLVSEMPLAQAPKVDSEAELSVNASDLLRFDNAGTRVRA